MFDSESSSDGGWIQWFCDLEGHEFFVEVEFDYIKDTFNLYGLKERIPRFNEAMKMILSSDSPDSEDLNDQSFLEVYQSAMDLYGLIHARYIISPRGLTMMREKYVLGTFGSCQRILCDRQLVLPIGLSEELSTSRVKTYCPRCQEVYVPRQKHLDIDGAYFGLSFPNILFKTYPDLYPKEGPLTYIPTIYGFKIFGQKGSAYEYKYDNNGNQINKFEIDKVLNKKITGLGGTGGGGPGATGASMQTMQAIQSSGRFDGSDGAEQVFKEDEQQPQAAGGGLSKQFNFNKSTTKNQPAVMNNM